MRHWSKVLAATVTLSLALAGCGSSSKGTPRTGAGGRAYTIGILSDFTGPAASGANTLEAGAVAGAGLAAKQGYTFHFVTADTQSSPSGALAAAQKLVDQDHVFAVIASSALAFAASDWLTQHGVPVIGAALDGPEWQTAANMFSVLPVTDETKVTTMLGDLFKLLGATNVASVGYSIPASSEAAKSAAASAEAAGLRAGYVNYDVPLGSTNVTPMVLGMKSAGIDGFIGAMVPVTTFQAINVGRQEDLGLKVIINASGYGGDLGSGGPDSQRIAQGVYFYFAYEPVEMRTAATKQLQHALSSYAHVTGEPTLLDYVGYLSATSLVTALNASGPNPTPAELISTLSHTRTVDDAGLLGAHPISFVPGQRVQSNVCVYVTRYVGTNFQLVAGADPICGSVIPGRTVSP